MSVAEKKRGWGEELVSGVFAGLTFPGIIVHECAHRFFCDLAGTPVYEVCYCQINKEPYGYVHHGEIKGMKEALLIAYGPLILNSILCMLLTFPLQTPLFILGAEFFEPNFILLGWIGFSVGIHAIPSNTDASSFVAETAQKEKKIWLYLCALPLYLLIRLANDILSRVCFHLIYAFWISMVLPLLLLKTWAWLTV